MKKQQGMGRRKFIKTMWGSALYLGSGLLAFPMGSCTEKRKEFGELDVDADSLDSLPELSPEEVTQFLDQAREAQDAYLGPDKVADGAPGDLPNETLDSREIEEIAGEVADTGEKPRVPPGQTVFDVMPVLGYNNNDTQIEQWSFYVKGEVEQELTFTWEQFQELPQTDQVCDVHCVTSWSVLDVAFGGVRVRDILEAAGLKDSGKFVIFDCEQGYTTNIPIAEALKDNVLIATRLFGEQLPQKYGGLARGLVPDRYYYKSGKWVVGIRVLDHDEPGYWEVRGYSNSADPWLEERFS